MYFYSAKVFAALVMLGLTSWFILFFSMFIFIIAAKFSMVQVEPNLDNALQNTN